MKKIEQIPVLERVAKVNDQIAEENRKKIQCTNTICLNIMGSPGSGKTTLIEKTIEFFHGKKNIAVIEGDLATTIDAERIRNLGAPVLQINTGGMCHLDAPLIKDALQKLALQDIDFLIIENVGNLVCPSAHDLGEDYRVVIASVPEGDDKPKKYPVIYKEADLMVITKIDLLEHFPDFSPETISTHAQEIQPEIGIVKVSARNKEGIAEWLTWISSLEKK
jgi:hydrogenase nickel incorporation protein HypB